MEAAAAVELNRLLAPIASNLWPTFTHPQHGLVASVKGHAPVVLEDNILNRLSLRIGHNHAKGIRLDPNAQAPNLSRDGIVQLAQAEHGVCVLAFGQRRRIRKAILEVNRLERDANAVSAGGAYLKLCRLAGTGDLRTIGAASQCPQGGNPYSNCDAASHHDLSPSS
jgi:hypothetical protein